ncbi:MAG: LPS assembly lipoprotein LptE [Deltaproteobacteria bacterium]
MKRWAPLLLLLAAACGYTTSARRADGTVHTIFVEPIAEPGLDLDAGSDVARAVRLAIARTSGLALADEATADHRLRVEILGVRSSLAPFAEPALRAAQYVVRITLRGVVHDATGVPAWQTPVVTGDSRFMSTPGGVEQLDGANRRTIEQASQEAAERLVTMIEMRFAGQGPVRTSTVSSPAGAS